MDGRRHIGRRSGGQEPPVQVEEVDCLEFTMMAAERFDPVKDADRVADELVSHFRSLLGLKSRVSK